MTSIFLFFSLGPSAETWVWQFQGQFLSILGPSPPLFMWWKHSRTKWRKLFTIMTSASSKNSYRYFTLHRWVTEVSHWQKFTGGCIMKMAYCLWSSLCKLWSFYCSQTQLILVNCYFYCFTTFLEITILQLPGILAEHAPKKSFAWVILTSFFFQSLLVRTFLCSKCKLSKRWAFSPHLRTRARHTS